MFVEVLHFSVAWKAKLPAPTMKKPMNVIKKIRSCPFFQQLYVPFTARLMKYKLVKVLTISAA